MKKHFISLTIAVGLVMSVQSQAQTIQPFSFGLSKEKIRANFGAHSYNCRSFCQYAESHRAAEFWYNNITGAEDAAPDLKLSEETKKAARFLMQATFGATAKQINQLATAIKNEGEETAFERWIDEQILVPQSELRTIIHNKMHHRLADAWWQHSIMAPDQLRQRMTFALNHIMTISRRGGLEHVGSIADYYDTLARNAFAKHKKLISDVTYNIGMGEYLDNSSNTGYGKPNENYARELLQLFTIGTDRLNLDGTPQLDETGAVIPTYNEDDVYDLALAITGLTREGTKWSGKLDMKWWRHAKGEKVLFRDTPENYVIKYKAKKSAARTDVGEALRAVTSHPNVAPFLAKRLIQHFVTSNPTPSYVQRVSTAFNNSRGSLKDTIKAVLLDKEARDTTAAKNSLQDKGSQSHFYGRAKEPVVRITNLMRAFEANPEQGLTIRGLQQPLYADSVFSFFQPNDTQTGAISEVDKVAPEFSLATDTNQVTLHNRLSQLVFNRKDNKTNTTPTKLFLKKESELALNNPAGLVDRYNLLLMGGTMNNTMRTTLINYLENAPENGELRARNALYLVMTSAQQAIQQ